jgi:hypothetical protein
VIVEESGASKWEWKFTKGLHDRLGIDQVGATDFVETANKVFGFPFNRDPLNVRRELYRHQSPSGGNLQGWIGFE